jgi:hypothetical protein
MTPFSARCFGRSSPEPVRVETDESPKTHRRTDTADGRQDSPRGASTDGHVGIVVESLDVRDALRRRSGRLAQPTPRVTSGLLVEPNASEMDSTVRGTCVSSSLAAKSSIQAALLRAFPRLFGS